MDYSKQKEKEMKRKAVRKKTTRKRVALNPLFYRPSERMKKKIKYVKDYKTRWKYKGYNIFLENWKPRRYRIVSYAGDFKPKIVNNLATGKKFIDKVLKV